MRKFLLIDVLLLLLAAVTFGQQAQYRKHGAVLLPDPRVTPGAVRTSDVGEICAPTFRTGPFRNTTQAMKNRVYRSYGVQRNKGICLGGCEVDHRVPLELGGNDVIANLWPQPSRPVPGFHEKDKLENSLRHRVCIDHTLTLPEAQRLLMGDWYSAYLKIPHKH